MSTETDLLSQGINPDTMEAGIQTEIVTLTNYLNAPVDTGSLTPLLWIGGGLLVLYFLTRHHG